MIRAGLAHPHPGVRAAACEACIECYRRVGRRLERHLHGQKGVPSAVVRSLKLAFMEVDQEALTRETDAAVAARWGAGGGDNPLRQFAAAVKARGGAAVDTAALRGYAAGPQQWLDPTHARIMFTGGGGGGTESMGMSATNARNKRRKAERKAGLAPGSVAGAPSGAPANSAQKAAFRIQQDIRTRCLARDVDGAFASLARLGEAETSCPLIVRSATSSLASG